MNPDTKPYLENQQEIITDDNRVNTKLGEKVSGGMVESALEELRAKKENLNSERLHIPNALDKKHKENTR